LPYPNESAALDPGFDEYPAELSTEFTRLRAVLPEHPWEASDTELARVIMSLPGPMVEAAIAAGVLARPAANEVDRSSGVAQAPSADLTSTHWSEAELVLAPLVSPRARASQVSSADAFAEPGTGWETPQPTVNPAVLPAAATPPTGVSTWTDMVQRAPSDRIVDHLPVLPAEAEQHAIPGREHASGESDEANLDHLAQDVFARLRWRLVEERERGMGWGI
jgi:hypothetical protein